MFACVTTLGGRLIGALLICTLLSFHVLSGNLSWTLAGKYSSSGGGVFSNLEVHKSLWIRDCRLFVAALWSIRPAVSAKDNFLSDCCQVRSRFPRIHRSDSCSFSLGLLRRECPTSLLWPLCSEEAGSCLVLFCILGEYPPGWNLWTKWFVFMIAHLTAMGEALRRSDSSDSWRMHKYLLDWFQLLRSSLIVHFKNQLILANNSAWHRCGNTL